MRAYLDEATQLPNNIIEECREVHNTFKRYLEETLLPANVYNTTPIVSTLNETMRPILEMEENDVLFSRCPSTTDADYHYITAIKLRGELHIFQKFGRYGGVRLLQITPERFEELIRIFLQFRQPENTRQTYTANKEHRREFREAIENIYRERCVQCLCAN